MNNREIRQLAWDRLMKGRWFWKLLGVSILLQICARAVLVFPFIFAILIGVCAVLGENSLWLIPLAFIMIISILAFFALMIFVPQYMAAG